MKKVGNITSNKLYNPQNKKPAIPIDADEADSAMERFIRSKYMNQGLSTMRSHNTGSTGSDETPPPLPPKTPGKFSFRSTSSTFPLFGRKKERASRSAHSSPQLQPESPDSGHRPKVSKVFGASLGYDSEDDVQKKLAKLRELGFTDDRRNETILKGVNGNLERTIETLVRIEGRSPVASPADEFPSVSRPSVSTSNSVGLTVARADTARPSTTSSTNPFDISPVQPISSQSTGNLGNRNPFFNNNPFGLTATQSNDALNQTFNNMSLGTSQPLFPHHTGGLPNQQAQQVIYQQSMTPPIPSIPQNYAATAFNSNQPYPQQGQQPVLQPAQPLQPMHTGYNPFWNNSQPPPSQFQQNQTLSLNTGLGLGMGAMPAGGGAYANNPFARSPSRMASPTSLGQIPEQTQQNFYSPPVQQQPSQVNNPFFAQQGTGSYAPQQPQYSQFGQPMVQQAPQRPDNASILALYNYPQLAPQPQQTPSSEQQQQQQQPAAHQPAQSQGPTSNQVFQAPNATVSTTEAPAASAAMTIAGNKNPFLGGGASASPAPAQVGGMDGTVGNRSRDSMMALGLEWSNGRHSPDAFASLSARSMR